MFEWSKTAADCRRFRVQLEELIESDGLRQPAACSDRTFEAHLESCDPCRQALEDARLANELMRDAAVPPSVAPEIFVARVMNAISADVSSQVRAIWRPLELLASRFALVAAAVLLALSVYLTEFAPPFREVATANSQIALGAGLPEPPAQPSNADEVLISIAETHDGI